MSCSWTLNHPCFKFCKLTTATYTHKPASFFFLPQFLCLLCNLLAQCSEWTIFKLKGEGKKKQENFVSNQLFFVFIMYSQDSAIYANYLQIKRRLIQPAKVLWVQIVPFNHLIHTSIPKKISSSHFLDCESEFKEKIKIVTTVNIS